MTLKKEEEAEKKKSDSGKTRTIYVAKFSLDWHDDGDLVALLD